MINSRKILTLVAAFCLSILVFFAQNNSVAAQVQGGCVRPGQCIGGQVCDCLDGMGCFLVPGSSCTVNDPTSITGNVEPPQGVAEYNAAGGIGILRFGSQIIFILNIIAGLFAMYNFLIAGLTYITTAGDSGAHNKVKDKLTYTFVGLALIVSTYTVGGLIGLIFYGDAGFLLNPQLQGAL